MLRGFRIALCAIVTFVAIASPCIGAENNATPNSFTFPTQIEAAQLVDLVGEVAAVSIHYDPQKITGTIRADVRQQQMTPAETWSVFNQILITHGYATVLSGSPAVYHVVPVGEAEATGMIFTSPEDAAAITPPPGFVTLVLPVVHVSPETAIQALTAVLGQRAQAKVVGREATRVVLSGDRERVLAGQRLLVAIDRAGNQVDFRTYQPQYAAGTKLQTALTAAWGAASKVTGRQVALDVQVLPDGQRLLVVSSAEDMPGALALLADLDRAEPTVTTTYRFEHFRLDDVAQLIEQLLGTGDDSKVKLVRDRLTGSLMVTATESQHQRIQRLLAELNNAPVASRQSMRSFVIKHRAAADLAAILKELTANGAGSALKNGATTSSAASTSGAGTSGTSSAPANPTAAGEQQASQPAESTFTIDAHTNSIIVLGHPQLLDQVAQLIDRLDRRQPQVEIEITLVSMSDSDTLALTTEWARITKSGDREFAFSQLFGASKQGTSVVDRTATGTGFTSLVINPGNYAALIQALSTVNSGRNVVTTKAVIDNSAEATINAVLQQPIANVNSNNNLASTSYGGTSDAGTQIKVKPLIGAADQVQLTFTVSQSAFVGQSTQTNDGGVIPAPKRQDSLASTVSIPDGHVIALGGLSNTSSSKATSGIPGLSAIPLIGFLFGSKTSEDSTSRFFLFIRADVMRHPAYRDLPLRSAAAGKAAGVSTTAGPVPAARLIE